MKTIILFVLSIFSFIFSCRTTPENEKINNSKISTNSPISVKINLYEIVFEDNNDENNLIAENNSQGGGGGNSLINNGLDTYTHYIDDYSFLDVTEITNTPQDNEYLSSLGLSSAIKSENLPNGTKYTILAYVYKRNYILYKQQEFTVGDVNPKIELDGGQTYLLFIVSTGDSTSVKIENVRDLDNLKFILNDSNPSFLYQRIWNFTPSGDKDNVLDVKLKGLLRISVILDASEFYPDNYHLKVEDIESIDNVKLTYRKYKGVQLKWYNDMIGVDGYEEVILPIKVTSFLNGKMQYKVDFQDTFIVDNKSDFKFYADVKVNGRNEISKISGRILPVKFGYRHTFLLKPMACGSYLRSNIKENNTNFRELMCRNLGETDDSPKGNLYAWGRKAIVEGKTSNNLYEEGDVWTEEENPCPVGFRVPTASEWIGVLYGKSFGVNTDNGKTTGNIKEWFIYGGSRHMHFYHVPTTESSKDMFFWVIDKFSDALFFNNYYSGYKGFEVRNGTATGEFARAIRCIRKLPSE